MKNLARGGAVLVILVLIAGLLYAQTQTGTASTVANDASKLKNNTVANVTNTENTSEVTNETDAKSKKLVKKTAKSTAVSSEGFMTFTATAYCLRGKMANGSYVRRGVVAADPRVLPLGTRIYLNGSGWSGSYVVADTGGVIKGRIIDVWVPTCGEAKRFGRRKVSVKVLGR